MSCLFCNLPEQNYKPDLRVDFICGECVILLADADQADLKNAFQKALIKGYQRKASALESFIIPEEIENEQVRPKSQPFSNRKRNPRLLRVKERPTRRPKKK